jgi:hypothetical protein
MALPATGLTFHVDASVDTDLWQVNTASVFSDHPVDGEQVVFWDDVEHTAICLNTQAGTPLWRQASPLMLLPCIDFDGTDDRYVLENDVTGVDQALSAIVTNSAFTMFFACHIEAATSNLTGAEFNHCLLSDTGGYVAVSIRKSGTDEYRVMFLNYDTGSREIQLAVNLSTNYIFMFRHEGGNIYASVNGGSESSTTSGNTGALTGIVRIGSAYNAGVFFNGRIGEIAIYNAALTGSNLTDAISYFTTKWITGAPAGNTGDPDYNTFETASIEIDVDEAISY